MSSVAGEGRLEWLHERILCAWHVCVSVWVGIHPPCMSPPMSKNGALVHVPGSLPSAAHSVLHAWVSGSPDQVAAYHFQRSLTGKDVQAGYLYALFSATLATT